MDLYSEAVQELIQGLEFPHERDKAETLGAILALSACEVCYKSSRTRQLAIRMSPTSTSFVSFEPAVTALVISRAGALQRTLVLCHY